MEGESWQFSIASPVSAEVLLPVCSVGREAKRLYFLFVVSVEKPSIELLPRSMLV